MAWYVASPYRALTPHDKELAYRSHAKDRPRLSWFDFSEPTLVLSFNNPGTMWHTSRTYPRAANYVIATKGSTRTYFYEENGAKLIVNTLTPNTMTIFPQAALHTMFNEGCTEATLVSALSSEDPGTLTFANSLFELPIDLVSNAFGGDISSFRSRVPNLASNAIAGTRDCLARCRK
ncbi:hypothetical protein TWF569_007253 [Orbilia oligospora]|nr:hypothetical protein TWF569_007253 [Orbilia oligospora]